MAYMAGRLGRVGLALGLVVLLGMLGPLAAGARPMVGSLSSSGPSPVSVTRVVAPDTEVDLSRVASLPVGARAGRAYALGLVVRSGGSVPTRRRIVVFLLRVGRRPVAIGSSVVGIAAHGSRGDDVRIRLPRVLADGSYALVACVRRAGASSALSCVTAEKHLWVGPGVARPRVRVSTDTPSSRCSSGAHSLSPFGSDLYPETGNGGYSSVHTKVFLDYDAADNLLLPGTHVLLTDQATQCLTDFSLDFERTSLNAKDGPDMSVTSVLVNGQPARFAFVQPTYPGDPNGQNDPDPRAHAASQLNPVGGPENNPFPPACTPELMSTKPGKQDSLDGTQCPANKLVVTPARSIPSGATFVVSVAYSGRPGVHNDGDGTTEGWFRNSQPNDAGSFVTTEPVGSEDWMPLNDHPSAKPTYDTYDTVPVGKTAIANGELVSQTTNGPDASFPDGSTTWHWHSPEAIASYLVEDSIGSFNLTERLATSGIEYYEAQDSSIPKNQAAANQAIMNMQEDIVNFQSLFNGPFPFTTDGVVIGVPSASFEEEMQTKITFAGGTVDLQTFNHENMHQWWGDNVSEANYNLTFFKEGLATFGEYLYIARNAQSAAGGPGTPAGDAAFENSLINSFDAAYADTGSLWTAAPSDPRPYTLFSGATTYVRPGIAYIALRQILGPSNFAAALQRMQAAYRQVSITEPELEAGFGAFLSDPSQSCRAQLSQFFTQWFDTAYPSGGGENRPQITGPGLDGSGFQCS
jgi:hypothetical protein